MKNIVKKFYFTFIAALLFFQAALLPAQDEGPRVVMLGTRDRPAAGSTWMLTLLIAHSEPNEVNILAPPFTGSILLEQVLKGPRYYNPVSGQTVSGRPPGTPVQAAETGRTASVQDTAVAEQTATPTAIQPENTWELWTAMEYRFSLGAAGTVNFDSFTVITPKGKTTTIPFSLTVQSRHGTVEKKRYSLYWENVPVRIQTGESAVFGLRIGDWHPSGSMPPASLFMPSVPAGYILETISPLPQEQAEGLVFRLKLIPLTPGVFTVEKKDVSLGNIIFEIPATRISINRPASTQTVKPAETTEVTEKIPPPFPPAETAQTAHVNLYKKHQGECDTVYITARNLWERGYICEALAVLRQAERDNPAGRFFMEIRRGVEQAIGFTGTGGEKRSFFPLFFRKKNRRAILRETAIRRIPDSSGETIMILREGQPVILDSSDELGTETKKEPYNHGNSWRKVTANDDSGISGWVPVEKIVFY